MLSVITYSLLYISFLLITIGIAAYFFVKRDPSQIPFAPKVVKKTMEYIHFISFPLFLVSNVYLFGIRYYGVPSIGILSSILLQWGYTFEVCLLLTSGMAIKSNRGAIITTVTAFTSAVILDPYLYKYAYDIQLSFLRSLFINGAGISAFILGYIPAKYLDEFEEAVEGH